MPSKTVTNASDCMVMQVHPTREYPAYPRMHVQSQTGDNRWGLVFFNLPFPRGVKIISAKLQLWNYQTISGSFTLQVYRASQKWAANRANWNNHPGQTGTAATRTISGAAAGTLWEVDVATHMQAVSNGAAWYGFVLDTSTVNKVGIFRSAQAAIGYQRPRLIVQWSEAPHQPTTLSPSAGRKVATQFPTLTYDFSDPNGEGDLALSQFQIDDTADLSSPVYDSGWVATDLPQWDLSATAYAGLPVGGATVYWRCRAQDEDGNISPWSDITSMAYLAKGVVTITTPSSTIWSDGSQAVAWSFTGATQKSYQVWVALASSPTKWIWDSGKITSSSTSLSIPFGNMTSLTATYRIGVRIWDTNNREGLTGFPAYAETTKDVVYTADGGVANVTSLACTPDIAKPNLHFTWNRVAGASHFQFLRSSNGGTTWTFYDEVTAAEALVSGTSYAWDDLGVDWYHQYTYKVISIVGGLGSTGVNINAKATKLAPFLMRSDGSDLVCFMNPERTRERMDIQEVHQRMSGSPVLVTQTLGGFTGHIKGLFYDNFPAGYTAEQMKDSFYQMRNDPGTVLRLSYADQSLKVVAYNMTYDALTDSTGVYYIAEFDWIQV